MAAKFVLKQSGKGKFTFTLQAPNGQVILTSETYSSRDSAVKGIASVRKNAGREKNFEVRKAKNGRTFFVLKAPNAEVIGKSQMYTDSGSMPKGMASVGKNAGAARVEDLSGGK